LALNAGAYGILRDSSGEIYRPLLPEKINRDGFSLEVFCKGQKTGNPLSKICSTVIDSLGK
jgi:hypothetical protein